MEESFIPGSMSELGFTLLCLVVREFINYLPLMRRWFSAKVRKAELEAGIQPEDNKPALLTSEPAKAVKPTDGDESTGS